MGRLETGQLNPTLFAYVSKHWTEPDSRLQWVFGQAAEHIVYDKLIHYFAYHPDIAVRQTPSGSQEDCEKKDIILEYEDGHQTIVQVAVNPWILNKKLKNDGYTAYEQMLLLPGYDFNDEPLPESVLGWAAENFREQKSHVKKELWMHLLRTTPLYLLHQLPTKIQNHYLERYTDPSVPKKRFERKRKDNRRNRRTHDRYSRRY